MVRPALQRRGPARDAHGTHRRRHPARLGTSAAIHPTRRNRHGHAGGGSHAERLPGECTLRAAHLRRRRIRCGSSRPRRSRCRRAHRDAARDRRVRAGRPARSSARRGGRHRRRHHRRRARSAGTEHGVAGRVPADRTHSERSARGHGRRDGIGGDSRRLQGVVPVGAGHVGRARRGRGGVAAVDLRPRAVGMAIALCLPACGTRGCETATAEAAGKSEIRTAGPGRDAARLLAADCAAGGHLPGIRPVPGAHRLVPQRVPAR